MRIQILSDLHLEHWQTYSGPWWFHSTFEPSTQTDADVLVLAGDILSWAPSRVTASMNRLTEFGTRYKHVVYVPGNHEFYGTSISEGMEAIADAETKIPGLQVLRPGRIVNINGQRFLGGTMWFPKYKTKHQISDHVCIRNFEKEVYQEHKAFLEFMEANLRQGDIAVTHHTPSDLSIPDRFAGSPVNIFFCVPSIERKLIKPKKPALWIHGHTHDAFDYQIEDTRVLCNPMGYPGEMVKFNPKLVVEL